LDFSNFDFPKSVRLLKGRDFLSLKSGAHCYKGKVLLIFYKKTDRPTSRLGITVSKKYGYSVQRNRFKRYVRESYRLLYQTAPYSVDCNVRPRATSETHIEFSDLFEDLKQFFQITLR
jgi:ribonuclease P protein component